MRVGKVLPRWTHPQRERSAAGRSACALRSHIVCLILNPAPRVRRQTLRQRGAAQAARRRPQCLPHPPAPRARARPLPSAARRGPWRRAPRQPSHSEPTPRGDAAASAPTTPCHARLPPNRRRLLQRVELPRRLPLARPAPPATPPPHTHTPASAPHTLARRDLRGGRRVRVRWARGAGASALRLITEAAHERARMLSCQTNSLSVDKHGRAAARRGWGPAAPWGCCAGGYRGGG